jgi:hypothetical protein
LLYDDRCAIVIARPVVWAEAISALRARLLRGYGPSQ